MLLLWNVSNRGIIVIYFIVTIFPTRESSKCLSVKTKEPNFLLAEWSEWYINVFVSQNHTITNFFGHLSKEIFKNGTYIENSKHQCRNRTGCGHGVVTPLLQYYCSKGMTTPCPHPVRILKYAHPWILCVHCLWITSGKYLLGIT